jgi:inhibitor of KinA sporulation pathway (predicted exonuclease)
VNYIVLDLEWNQSPIGKKGAVAGIPFEIIQIGAVKLNERFEEIDSFDAYVKPIVYSKMQRAVSEIIHVTMEELKENGEIFSDVADRFFKWCGDDFIFCTWGEGDLVELQRNVEYHGLDYKFAYPLFFYDLQRLYSMDKEDKEARYSLQDAIKECGLPEKKDYHSAINDARYTGQIMAFIDMEAYGAYKNIDNHTIPDSIENEIHIDFPTYNKYISKGFRSADAAINCKRVTNDLCYICGLKMKKRVKWFFINSKSGYCLYECPIHGSIAGRIRIKQNDAGLFFASRFMKKADKAQAENIKDKYKKYKEKEEAKKAKNQPNKPKS